VSTAAEETAPPGLVTRRPLVTAPGRVEWADASLTLEPAAGHVRIRTRMTLASPGTELRLFRGEPMVAEVWDAFADLDDNGMGPIDRRYRLTAPNQPGGPVYPIVFGYNNVGEVTALGEGVSGLAVGDRVVTTARHREVFDVPEWHGTRIPEEVGDEAAAFAYLATLGLYALRRGSYAPGENVAVIGLGVVGLLAALVADACGATVVALDLDADRRGVAAAALPDAHVLDPTDPSFAADLEARLAPQGVDIVLEAGAGAASLDLAFRLADAAGRVVSIALHPEELGTLLSADFYNKRVALLGTSNDPFEDPRERLTRFTIGGNVAYVLDLQRRGRLRLQQAHTHTYPARDISEAYTQLAAGRRDMVGVLVDWRDAATSPSA
jgi:threonine dehydrogenase-like Zn-dependent dehydrogenase